MKDITLNEIDLYNKGPTRNHTISSLEFLIHEAWLKEGLDIVGFKLNYLDKDNAEVLEKVFNKKTPLGYHADRALISIVIRGIDAFSKVQRILGHFNPEMARKTNEFSMRAFFGQTKDENCVFDIKAP